MKEHMFSNLQAVYAQQLFFRINTIEPMIYVEDIGRHNAIDNIVGWGFLRNIDFSKNIYFNLRLGFPRLRY